MRPDKPEGDSTITFTIPRHRLHDMLGLGRDYYEKSVTPEWLAMKAMNRLHYYMRTQRQQGKTFKSDVQMRKEEQVIRRKLISLVTTKGESK